MVMSRSWDIFCSVVDNFGDIGVCWRLARRLSSGLGHRVRIWVDDLESFKRLCGKVDAAQPMQVIDGIEIRHWRAEFPDVAPADIVIEGFGVKLPDSFLQAMVARRPTPVWINLEYLSAEAWVDGHHGLPSPHPRLPLTKYFFFPGFTAATGGVLIEDGLIAARDAFQADEGAQREFRRTLGIDSGEYGRTWVSLFCYENAALPELVSACAADARGINCIVPEGLALAQLARIAGRAIAPGMHVKIGGLNICAVAFLDLDQYDRLLWSCDLNFVRGEDSFVRAQLAARPLVWQAYPQDEDAHLRKADAFRQRYCERMAPADAAPYDGLFDAWNRQAANCGDFWPALSGRIAALSVNAENWARRLAGNGDLGANLARFCEDRLK
jgi:uncharacterized repeat protein (TIGR03837 family)